MSKYYKFRYDAGYAGTEDSAVYKFPDDVPTEAIQVEFNDWYESCRTDSGDFEAISEDEAAEAGIDVDYDC